MLATGCPDDGTNASGTETEGEDSSSTGEDTTVTTTQSDTTVSSTMTDPTTTSPETTDPDSSSSAEETGCEGVCQEDTDCLPGQSCIACICVGEPSGCAEWGPGAFDNCVDENGPNNALCTEGGFCLNGGMDIGACSYNCTEMCDCPAPPAGFEDQVVCADVTADMMNDCYLDCSDGQDCPEGTFCFMGTACLYGEAPMGIPPYGDCVNMEGTCEMATCLVDNVMNPSLGWCAQPCMDANDDAACAPAPGGTATPSCSDLSGEGDFFCELDCSGGATCPDGMTCLAGPDFCVWEFMPPPMPGYGDCANNDAMEACLDDETCLDGASGSVCTAPCTMADECPDAPATGDAPVACGDLGMGDTCYLDCSAGQTCPDFMQCVDDSYCDFPALAFAFEEDFEGGELPAGWVIHDVDMQVPDDEVAFVDAAWVVTDEIEMGTNFAAYSTSYYAPVGQADDWLVTPQIMLGAASVLRWDGLTPNATYPDGYEVYVSTTGSDVADFTDPPVFTIAAEAQEWTQRQVDLSGYANQAVYIAWRNNSTDELILLIDNIQVSE